MKINIDTSQVRNLVTDLGSLDTNVSREVPAIVKRGALNIKKDMQAEMKKSSNPGMRYVATQIHFDELDDGLTAEIGPEKYGPGDGSLANIAYFGTSKGGGTVEDPKFALERETPNFIRELEKIIGEL